MTAVPRPNLAVTLPEVMSPGEVARLLNVDPKTLTRHDDVLQPFRTLGGHGHRRYRREVVAVVAARPLLDRWSR